MECDWAIIEKFVMKSAECKVWECDLRVKNFGPVTISIDKLTSGSPMVTVIDKDERTDDYPILLDPEESADLNCQGRFLPEQPKKETQAEFCVDLTQLGSQQQTAQLCARRPVVLNMHGGHLP